MNLDNNKELILTMIQTLISKYGLLLNSNQTAEVLGISSRTLDERRKSCSDCPNYIEGNGKKSFMFPVQNIVEYQLKKSQQSVKTIF
ncbi:hypothetical protein [Aliarcobacter cibarius]|uniref:DNA-binding protein n=1 Tax=Aliarcobacter cibarius TaxID=255507 RepID=A0A7L5JQ42_9BACT|nr:hypothetical protein [Aliarcobacter cibarius]QKJ27342.1 hypothetical protein ACBT_1436 [Aliarcobacter cibarius]TLT02929.1 hypothetical protein FE248_08605 [Aliarcobacter cibarius]